MPEIVKSKTVITRKPHHCWGCTKEYPAGSEMACVVSVDGGVIGRAYWCNSCNDFLRKHGAEIDPWNDGFCYGDLLYDMEGVTK